jgi:hypothetical protein
VTDYVAVTFFFSLEIGRWSPYWVHAALRPLLALLYLSRVIVRMEKSVEWELAGETEVLGENLYRRHFVHNKSHLPDPGANPGRLGGKPATNRFSYGIVSGSPSPKKNWQFSLEKTILPVSSTITNFHWKVAKFEVDICHSIYVLRKA